MKNCINLLFILVILIFCSSCSPDTHITFDTRPEDIHVSGEGRIYITDGKTIQRVKSGTPETYYTPPEGHYIDAIWVEGEATAYMEGGSGTLHVRTRG